MLPPILTVRTPNQIKRNLVCSERTRINSKIPEEKRGNRGTRLYTTPPSIFKPTQGIITTLRSNIDSILKQFRQLLLVQSALPPQASNPGRPPWRAITGRNGFTKHARHSIEKWQNLPLFSRCRPRAFAG